MIKNRHDYRKSTHTLEALKDMYERKIESYTRGATSLKEKTRHSSLKQEG